MQRIIMCSARRDSAPPQSTVYGGLPFDLHVHFCSFPGHHDTTWPPTAETLVVLHGVKHAERTLWAGFTTVATISTITAIRAHCRCGTPRDRAWPSMHAPTREAIRLAFVAGADTIEHGWPLDDELIE